MIYKEYLFLIFVGFLFSFGCSSNQEITKTKIETRSEIDRADQDFKKKAMDHFINGSIAEAKGDFATAVLEFQDALNLDPSAGVYYALGKNYYNLNKLSLAIQNSRKAVELNPNQIEYFVLLSNVYSTAKQFDSAAETLENALQLDSTDVELYYKLARLYESSKPLKAIETYEKVIAIIGPDWNVLIRVAELYEKLGNLDAAVSSIEKLISLDPANVSLQKILIDFYQKSNKLDKALEVVNDKRDSAAIEYFKVTTDLARWNVDAWIRLGGLYFDNKKYEEVVKVMDEAIELFPDDFTINLILGLSLAQLDKHSEAKPYLKNSVELNPNDLNSLSSYAYTLSQLKENDLAINYLKQALTIKPDDVNLLGTLGLIYDAMKMWTECDSVYERALQIDSQNALVNNNFAYSLSERGERLKDALTMAEIAIAADPNNTSYLDTIGWVYFKLGNYSEAKDNLEKAIEIGGERAVMLEHLGDIMFKLGDTQKAKSLWQKSYDLDTTNVTLKSKIDKG